MPRLTCPRCRTAVEVADPRHPSCPACGLGSPAAAPGGPALPAASRRTAPSPARAAGRRRLALWVALGAVGGVLLLAAASAVVFVLADGSRGPAPPSCRAGEPYDHPSGFQACAPAAWEVQENQLGLALIALSPAASPDDGFRENLNVQVVAAGGKSLDETADEALANLEAVAPGFELLERHEAALGGAEARAWSYTMRQGSLTLHGEQVLAIRGGNVYVVTYTAEDGAQDAYRTQVRDFLRSFAYT